MCNRKTVPSRPWYLGRWGLPLLVVLAVGCGGGGQGEVSGKVTYKNAPVPGGWLTFRPADGRHNPVSVELEKDGTYKTVTLPVGDVHVSIDNRELAPQEEIGDIPLGIPLSPEAKKVLGGKKERPARPSKGGKRSDRYLAIPPKYHEAETANLKFKVTRGQQTKNFELTD